MADLLAAALAYADAGIAVFPARVGVSDDGRKYVHPVKAWRDASSTDPAVIRTWFAPGQPWATGSLCIDCGKSGLVVVDLDVTGGRDGISAWGELMAQHDVAPTPVRSHTPSGGEHWFYAAAPGRPVGIDSSGKVAAGIDVRGDGGFVIAWPSEDARGAYSAIVPGELPGVPLVPDIVVERMIRRADVAVTGNDRSVGPASVWDEFGHEFTYDAAVAWCRPAIEALRSAPVGQINHRLNDAAVTLGHFVPEFWSEAAARRALHAALAYTEYDGRTWRAEATIASGLGARTWKATRGAERPAERAVDERRAAPDAPVRRGRFAGVAQRQRAEPAFLTRDDGKALLYPGKDSYLYAETESGKSWLAALTVVQCVTSGVPVMVVDFEEGDELEYGQRLLALGLTEAQLDDPTLFRYLMVDGKCTAEVMAEADDMGAAVVVNEGMSVAYDVYGLQVKENDSATYFRRTLVKPHLVAGRAVLTTDHVVKDRDNRGRYAIGGVMKLNAASGGAFLLINVEGLAPGRRGVSNLYVTKDRPGGVKRHGVSAGEHFDPQVRRFGTLVVDDSRDRVSYLDVRIAPPAVDEAIGEAVRPVRVAVLAALARLDAAGRTPHLRALRAEAGGNARAVDDEIELMLTAGILAESRGDHGARVFERVRDLDEEEVS